jgi:hypothetical protein
MANFKGYEQWFEKAVYQPFTTKLCSKQSLFHLVERSFSGIVSDYALASDGQGATHHPKGIS